MFFKKKRICYWAWTSANGKWDSRENADKKLDTFLERIHLLEGVKVYKKRHYIKHWKNQSITDIYYVKFKFSIENKQDIWDNSKSAGVALSSRKPLFF